MISRTLRYVAVIGCAALVASGIHGPAAAQTIPPEFTINASGWTGGAQGSRDTGRFSHCGISREYGNGLTLVFLLSPQYQLNIGLLNPAWTLLTDAAAEPEPEEGAEDDDEDEQPPVARIDVDGQYVKEFPARPVGETVLMIATGVDEQLMDLLMRGNNLVVGTERGSYRFALSGTFAGLSALRGCIDTARRLAAEANALAERQAVSISGEAVAGILRDAGLQNAAVTPVDSAEHPLGLSYAWSVGSLRGGVVQARRGQAIEIDGFTDAVINRFAATCSNEFQQSAQEAEILRDLYAFKRAILQCGADGSGSVVALLVALDDNFYTAFFHQGDAGDRAAVIDATDRVHQLIRRQAGG